MRPTLQTPSTRPYSTPGNINNIADYYVSSHTFIFDYVSVADRMGSHYGQPFLQKPDLRQQASQSFVNIFCMFQIMLTLIWAHVSNKILWKCVGVKAQTANEGKLSQNWTKQKKIFSAIIECSGSSQTVTDLCGRSWAGQQHARASKDNWIWGHCTQTAVMDSRTNLNRMKMTHTMYEIDQTYNSSILGLRA